MDHEGLFAEVNHVVRSAPSVSHGIRSLVQFCANEDSDDRWNEFLRLEFDEEADRVAGWIDRVAAQTPLRPTATHWWFGLGDEGDYLYLVGYPWDPFVDDPIASVVWEADERPSLRILAEIRRIAQDLGGGIEAKAEYSLCLGFAALAVRLGLDKIKTDIQAVRIRRSVLVGFDGGDYLGLGIYDIQRTVDKSSRVITRVIKPTGDPLAEGTPTRRLVDWTAGELVRCLALSQNAADAAAQTCFPVPGNVSVGTAATTVSIARAVEQYPQGRIWWENARAIWIRLLLAGEPGEVEARLAEFLAEPAPDVWDPNWPARKLFGIQIPEGLQIGDSFLVGDGMGARARMMVTERQGERGVVIVPQSSTNPLSSLFREACDEAERLVGESPDASRRN